MRSFSFGFLSFISLTLIGFAVVEATSAGVQLSPYGPGGEQASVQKTRVSSPSETKPPSVNSAYHEDFASLSLDTSSLKHDTAILGERDDRPEFPFIRERWQMMWRPGDPLDLYIIKPRGVKNPPVVLYLYSHPQDTERFKSDVWCGQVTGDGFAAVGFVSANTGHRLENLPPREFFFSELQTSLGATVHDVQMILDFLANSKEVDMNRVGMFGQGSGGSIAILASAVDPRIKAIDLLTPWGDWPTFLSNSTFIPAEIRSKITSPEFLSKVAPLDPLQWLPKIKAQSIRMQNVRSDGHMPDAAEEHLEAVAPDFAEIDQFGDRAALVPATANGRLLGWIKTQLQPDAKPHVAMEKSQRIHFYPAKAPVAPLPMPHQ